MFIKQEIIGFLEAGLSFWKIPFEIGLHAKNVRFFNHFQRLRNRLYTFSKLPLFQLKLVINLSSSKTRSWDSHL